MDLSPRSKLKVQLAVVDRAIEKLVNGEESDHRPSSSSVTTKSRFANIGSTLIASSSSSKLAAAPIVAERDESYKIATTGIQAVLCPFCGEEVDAKQLARHKESTCNNCLTTCPNPECKLTIHLKQMKFHLKHECISVKNRRKILEQAQQRALDEQRAEEERMRHFANIQKLLSQPLATQSAPSSGQPAPSTRPVSAIKMVMCPDCTETMRESTLPHHLIDECRCRRVMCPNYGFGCKEQAIPLASLQEHIAEHCNAEKHRQQMYMKSRHRFEKLQCSTCGDMVMLKDWRKHEHDDCENRLIPCKNHGIGCQVMVPKRERGLHEHLEEDYARHCLYMSGHGTYLNINENDIVFPWTAEMWIYRPIAQESLKTHIINFLLQLPAYLIAYSTEVLIKDKVLRLVAELKSDVSKSKDDQVMLNMMSKAERQVWQQERVQQRMHCVNELQMLTPVYSDAVVAFLKTWQSLAICIEAGMGCMFELEMEYRSNRVALDALKIPIEPSYPGVVGVVNAGLNYFASPLSESRPITVDPVADVDIAGSTQASVAEQFSEAAEDPSEHNSVNTSVNNISSSVTEALQAGKSAYSVGISYDDSASIETLFAMYDAAPTDTSYLAHHLSNSCKNQLRKIIQEQEEARRKAEEEAKEEEAAREVKEGEDDDTLSTATHQDTLGSQRDNNSVHSARSVESSKVPAGDETKSEGKLSKQGSMQRGDLVKQTSQRGILSKRGSKLSFSNLAVGDDDLDDELQNEIFKDIAHYNDDIVCPTYAHFLLDYHMAAAKAFGLHQLGISTWKQFLDDMAKALKSDFDQLQDWRLEAGLLTPDAKSEKMSPKVSKKPKKESEANEASEADSEVENSGNEKESKKEKAAKKKEKERQRRELKKLKTQQEELEKKLQEQQQQAPSNGRKASNAMAPASSKLLTRCTDLFRANCGAEILMDSNTVNKDQQRCRLCLSMFSGLSLLIEEDLLKKPVEEDAPPPKDHHYELLIPHKELHKLSLLKGYFGHVLAYMDPLTITEKIGSQPIHYSLKIPRGRWTHIAVTTSRHKMTLYMDGKMIYASRETSIPLPMSSLGGSPNSLLNFRGCLLDVRLWNHLKSEKQVNAFMHRMLDMNKKKVVDGCIAWYTMEDGPGNLLSTDITRHRFKTPLANSLSFTLSYVCNQTINLPTICISELPTPLHPFVPKEVWEEIGFPENFKRKTSKLRVMEKLRCQFAKTQWIKAESVNIYSKMPARMLKNMESGQRAMRLASNLPFYLLESLSNDAAAKDKDGGDNQSVNSDAPGLPGTTYSSVLPLPSYREMNICPFEIRKVKLAQSGRLLQRRFPCPLGCGEELRAFDKRYHVRHVCPRRLVRCRFDFCPCMYPAEEQDIHENSTNCEHMADCIKWLKHAAYSHKQLECSQCREKVIAKDLEHHMKKECEYRNIHCPYRDCHYGELLSKDASLPAHRLESHLKLECTSQKRKILFMLVERARERHPYPRPWGLTVELSAGMDLADGREAWSTMTDTLTDEGDVGLLDQDDNHDDAVPNLADGENVASEAVLDHGAMEGGENEVDGEKDDDFGEELDGYEGEYGNP